MNFYLSNICKDFDLNSRKKFKNFQNSPSEGFDMIIWERSLVAGLSTLPGIWRVTSQGISSIAKNTTKKGLCYRFFDLAKHEDALLSEDSFEENWYWPVWNVHLQWLGKGTPVFYPCHGSHCCEGICISIFSHIDQRIQSPGLWLPEETLWYCWCQVQEEFKGCLFCSSNISFKGLNVVFHHLFCLRTEG